MSFSSLIVTTLLSQGGVPQRPVVFVSRPELLNRVREKLYRLQKDSGWVTVFGMAGSGKSVLAAEAVRHQGVIEGDHIWPMLPYINRHTFVRDTSPLACLPLPSPCLYLQIAFLEASTGCPLASWTNQTCWSGSSHCVSGWNRASTPSAFSGPPTLWMKPRSGCASLCCADIQGCHTHNTDGLFS